MDYEEASFNIQKDHSTLITLNWFDIDSITLFASVSNSRFGEVFVIDDLCVQAF